MEAQDLEQELKRALDRQDPRADFTDRVLARVEGRQSTRRVIPIPIAFPVLFRWRLVPVLASALIISVGGLYWRHERITQGQRAKQKLIIAMHIAGAELYETRQRTFEIQTKEVR